MSSGVLAEFPPGIDLTFDRERRTLCVQGRRVVLDTRSALVFETLAERFGTVVSKDTLLAAAWPGQLVHENSLAKAISRLRAAINGSGLVITAVYGLGYTLEQADAEGDGAQGEAVPLAQPRQKGHRFRLLFAPVAILLATAVAAFALNRPAPDVPIRTALPVTHDGWNAVATVLWVDDHPSNNTLEVDYLKTRRIAVHLAESTDDALKLLRMNSYQLVVSDLGRGEDRLAGLRLARIVRERAKAVPVIIYTVRPNSPTGQQEQRRMVAEAGVTDLALTPEEVRAKIVGWIEKQRASPSGS